MPRYAMLLLPSANRVYASASAELARAELAVFSESVLAGALSDGDVVLRLPSTATYDVIATTQLGSTSVTVPRSAGSANVIKASSKLGSVTVTSRS